VPVARDRKVLLCLPCGGIETEEPLPQRGDPEGVIFGRADVLDVGMRRAQRLLLEGDADGYALPGIEAYEALARTDPQSVTSILEDRVHVAGIRSGWIDRIEIVRPEALGLRVERP
jgi:hypothetical protein